MSDVSLKSSLAQLLRLLKCIIESAEDIDAMDVALENVGKLSRVYGKSELPLFESILPTVVCGLDIPNDVSAESTLNCLLSMLYLVL